jgi:hypothetical protein
MYFIICEDFNSGAWIGLDEEEMVLDGKELEDK